MSYVKQRDHDSRELNRRRHDIPRWVTTGEMEEPIQMADDPDRAAGVGTAVRERMEPEGLKQSPTKDTSFIWTTQSPEPKSHHPVDADDVDSEKDSLPRHSVQSQRGPVDSFIEDSFVVTFIKDPVLNNNHPKNEEIQSTTSVTTDASPLVVAKLTPSTSDPAVVDIADKSPETVVLEEPSTSLPTVVRSVRFSEKDPSIIENNGKVTSKWNGFGRSRSSVLFSGLAVIAIIAIIILGTVCGTGNCQASKTSSAAAPELDDVAPTNATTVQSPMAKTAPTLPPVLAPSSLRPVMAMTAPTFLVEPPIPSIVPQLNCSIDGPIPFTSTSELFAAVDAYIALSDVLGEGFNENTTQNYNVTICYGYPMNAWDVSRITDFSRLFDPNRDLPYARTRNKAIYSKVSKFNEDLNDWDTSSAVTMFGMFAFATAFNGNISNWNLSSVTNTSDMFYHATLFNGRNNDISQWDVSSVQSMAFMFAHADNFVGDVSLWDTGSVVDLQSTFEGTTFLQTDLSKWNTSNVVNMARTFKDATSFDSDLSGWDVSKVETMEEMFQAAQVFRGNISQWDVSRVSSMAYMFHSALLFDSDLSLWDVSKVVNMRSMFAFTRAFSSDLSNWDVSNVVTMTGMFSEATSFAGDLSAWNVSKVQYMDYMFFDTPLFDSDISQWDVRNVKNMGFMFQNADIFNQDVSMWNVSNVKTMNSMLYNATSFNQSLCLWGAMIPSSREVDVTNMFTDSGCDETTDPVLILNPLQSSSWCQACNV